MAPNYNLPPNSTVNTNLNNVNSVNNVNMNTNFNNSQGTSQYNKGNNGGSAKIHSSKVVNNTPQQHQNHHPSSFRINSSNNQIITNR